MYILGIETTDKNLSICLSKDYKVFIENNYNMGVTHSVVLFDAVKKLLDDNSIKVCDIEKIVVSNGPGSFTGIRIGIAFAMGLSINKNIKIHYADTLESLSYNYCSNDNNIIIPMIDAKVNRVYMCVTDKNHKKIFDDLVISVDDLIFLLNKYFTNFKNKIIFIGSGVTSYKNILIDRLKVNYDFIDEKTVVYSHNDINIKYFGNSIDKYNIPIASSLILASANVKSSNKPVLNYILKSKAERELYDKNR